jgi:2-iminobutanoate/2-iminopropanoate deaminase
MKKLSLIVSITFLCTGLSSFSQSQVIYTDKAPKPIGPYSQAILKNNMLFVSGQIAINSITNQLDTTSIENETKQVMENIKNVLQAAGMDFSQVVKTTIYLTDLNNFKKVNDLYANYFKENPPARETVQVSALPKHAHVEISVTAIK